MLSLYEATIPSFKQTIGVMRALLAKGRTFCQERDIDLETLAETRLVESMLPLRFQVRAGLHFSMGCLAALNTGTLAIPKGPTTHDYTALETLVDDALFRLDELTPAEIDDHVATIVTFDAGTRKPVFTGQGLLLSFALPNLHFHTTTAYDILRLRGVELGKRDYLGAMTFAPAQVA